VTRNYPTLGRKGREIARDEAGGDALGGVAGAGGVLFVEFLRKVEFVEAVGKHLPVPRR
jgi:hypothetical protein